MTVGHWWRMSFLLHSRRKLVQMLVTQRANMAFSSGCNCKAMAPAKYSKNPNNYQIQRYYSETSEEKSKEKVEPWHLRKPAKRNMALRWESVVLAIVTGSFCLYLIRNARQKKQDLEDKQRRASIGKSKIGGPWQLKSMEGKESSEQDFLGQWTVIYFGFTHCPDVCPDEIEKMCSVVDILDEDKQSIGEKTVPLFFSVDPNRDTPDAVKKYCEEFSPKLKGFTGTEEQVKKVCKAFRVYYMQGPKDQFNDYIVDHTVITYLVGPDGHFLDYYGQDKTAQQIADAIKIHMLKYARGKQRGLW